MDMLTFAIADDVAGIVVIALVYSGHINLAALAAGVALLGLVVAARRLSVRHGPAYLLPGVAAWTAFFESGVDPVVAGLVMGLLALAYPATRRDLERAFEAFRLFREQPTPELARAAQQSARLAMSPNDRVQQLFHPWTSYLVVPLFALANAGITVDGSLLARTYTSPVTALLPEPLRARALLGAADTITDLAVPVDPERDHVRGADQALVTLVEYGDYECPYCGEAEPVIRELLAGYGDLRYVWRHLPLTDVHPHALLAAEGAEAAARQGKFWQMHDQLLAHQDALTAEDLIRYAGGLGLDTGRFTADLCRHAGDAKIAEDLDSAGLSGVSGTPSFFVNGKRHRGAYDIDTLAGAVRAAKAQALISSGRQPQQTS